MWGVFLVVRGYRVRCVYRYSEGFVGGVGIVCFCRVVGVYWVVFFYLFLSVRFQLVLFSGVNVVVFLFFFFCCFFFLYGKEIVEMEGQECRGEDYFEHDM